MGVFQARCFLWEDAQKYPTEVSQPHISMHLLSANMDCSGQIAMGAHCLKALVAVHIQHWNGAHGIDFVQTE